jgi:tetratricopeptide (TPR) repeat protein
MAEIPDHMGRRPERFEYAPPIEPRPRLLPFGEIPWEEFEALSLELFEQQHGLVDKRLYAGRGQGQDGIDLYGVTPEQTYETAQCRRVRALTPGAIAGMVDDFLEGPWADRSSSLTLFTAATTESDTVAGAIEEQRERLAAAGVPTFTVRDLRSLSIDLRSLPELVDAYFGPHWRQAFCPGEDHETSRAQGAIDAAEILVAAAKRPRYFNGGSLNTAVRKAVEDLLEHHEDEYALLEPLLNDQHAAARAARWIADPPEPLAGTSWRFWVVVTRVAERGGDWRAGADGWLRISEMKGGDLRAIVNASIAAGVAGDRVLEEQLLDRARAIDPDHPKIRLQEARDLEKAEDQLKKLEGVSSDDEGEQVLLELNRALAYLQLPDLDAAEAALARAEASPKSEDLLQLDMVRANAVIQRHRLAAGRQRPTDAQAMAKAEADCLKVREALIGEHRYGESVRALMLAVDTAAVRFDFTRAEALLGMATENEITAEYGSGVLGDAALRCGVPRLAFRFLEHADETDETRRIRAVAKLALRQDVDQVRDELSDLALGDGPEAELAALAHCKDAAFHRGPWDDEVAAVLRNRAPIDTMLLEARHLARSARYDRAKDLLEQHDDDPQAMQLLFELANKAEDPQTIELVPRVLAVNPDRHHRLLVADFLLTHKDGDVESAEAQARLVAEDPAGSAAERSDAYGLLMRILARAERWKDAQRELNEWIRVDVSDERINFWQMRVGSQLSRNGG